MKNEKVEGAIRALLKSEGIDILHRDKAIKSLSQCCSPTKCIKIYMDMIQ